MTVGSGVPYNQHTGNGVTATFAYGFTLLDAEDFVATIDGTETSAYTLSGIGDAVGGTCTFDTPPASGADIIVRRLINLVRETDYQTNGDLQADTVNHDHDREWMAIQQVSATTAGAIRAPFPETLNELPALADRLGSFLWFDETTGQPVGVPGVEQPFNPFTEETVTVAADGDREVEFSVITFTPGIRSLRIERNGIGMRRGVDYTEDDDGAGVTFLADLVEGDEITALVGIGVNQENRSDSALIPYTRYPGAPFLATNVKSRLGDLDVSVTESGALLDGTTDDAGAINEAVEWVGARGGGNARIPFGTPRIASTIEIDQPGVRLIGNGSAGIASAAVGGAGVVPEGVHAGGTRIIADFVGAPALRIYQSNCTVRELTIDASSARKAGGALTDVGILVEAHDIAGYQSTRRTHIAGVRVSNQPGHGIVLCNDVVGSRVELTDVDHIKGHGVWVTGGIYSGRTHKTHPGIVQISNVAACWTGGHSLLIGGNETAAFADEPYRIEVNNFEAFYACITPAILIDPANPSNGFISGQSIEVYSSAFDGRTEYPSLADAHSALTVRGENIGLTNIRCIDGNPYAVFITNIATRTTRGVKIERLYVVNTLQAAGFYNPAVYYGSNVRGVSVSSELVLSSVTKLSSRVPGSNFRENWNGVAYDEVASGGPIFVEVALADDKAGYIDFGAVCRGVLTLSGNTLGAGAAVVSFRVGDGNAHATVMSSSGPTVTGTTGTLAGTTGTDAHLTVSADTASNRLYIENRTGGVRSYSYDLQPLSGFGAAPSSFVNLP